MKVVTILAGAISFNLPLFILAAVVARGAKFFLLGWALQRWGEPIAELIHKRLATVALIVLALAAVLWLAKLYL